MKKLVFLAASAAVILASCAKIENEANVALTSDEPVALGAYTGKAVTKAGATGELTNEVLRNGFGVFAYQTRGTAALATPNFMYNTKVYGNPWNYDIIKYWPNQIQAGNTDSQSPAAQAEQIDKVSFFAYAPYVNHKVALGTTGITALTANNASGDPKVTYTVGTTLDQQVDLCWGVVNPAEDLAWKTVANTTINLAKGMPFLGLQKPAAANKTIHFYFRHALAQINLKAVAAYDQVAAGGTAKNDVKITIKEVVLTVPGMNTSAKLNLNNTAANTPKWEDAAGSSDLVLTVDGDNIHADLKDAGEGKKASEQPAGVTASEHDVIVANKYFTVLPAGAKTINVKVTYYVTTDDADLATGFSRVENVISHDVDFTALAAGTKNTIKMILGISEVKFEAEVSNWETGVDSTVDLPVNNY